MAGSMAEHFSVAQMTDILAKDELVDLYADAAAERRSHFSNLREKGYENVKEKEVRRELARSAFGYLADVRGLWHRGTRAELQDIA